jgi:hypothetical protein
MQARVRNLDQSHGSFEPDRKGLAGGRPRPRVHERAVSVVVDPSFYESALVQKVFAVQVFPAPVRRPHHTTNVRGSSSRPAVARLTNTVIASLQRRGGEPRGTPGVVSLLAGRHSDRAGQPLESPSLGEIRFHLGAVVEAGRLANTSRFLGALLLAVFTLVHNVVSH